MDAFLVSTAEIYLSKHHLARGSSLSLNCSLLSLKDSLPFMAKNWASMCLYSNL